MSRDHPTNAEVIADLTRAKVMFQARSVVAHITGAPSPDIGALFQHDFDPHSCFCRVCRLSMQDAAEGIAQECKAPPKPEDFRR